MPTKLGWLETNHISDIMTWMLEARGILVGSPTLNSHMLPTVAGAMTYVSGLHPRERLGLAFGSHGWGRQGVTALEEAMDQLGWQRPVESVTAQWRPTDDVLAGARQAGAQFARRSRGREDGPSAAFERAARAVVPFDRLTALSSPYRRIEGRFRA